jgi:RNA polymerase sigma factor (sigma-70 family)
MYEQEHEFAALMEQVLLADNQALASLIALYEPDIRRAAQTMLGRALRPAIDPLDLVQSVHLQLILGLKHRKFAVRSPRELRSLAVTVLRNKFIQHWRRLRCQARHSTAIAMAGAPPAEKNATAVATLDPAHTAEYNDLLDHLLGRLRDDERRLIIMRLHGFRTHEIAAELGIDPATLRVRFSRLRKRLKELTTLTG